MAPQPIQPARPPSSLSEADKAFLRRMYNMDSPGLTWHFHEEWFKFRMTDFVQQWRFRHPIPDDHVPRIMPRETWDTEVDRLVELWVQEPVMKTIHHPVERIRMMGSYENSLRTEYAKEVGRQIRYFLKVHLRGTDMAGSVPRE